MSRGHVPQEPPIDGDFVHIPDGQTVLLDESPPELFFLLVEGSLVFDRQNLALDTTYFLLNGGSLEIGTPEEPFLHCRFLLCVRHSLTDLRSGCIVSSCPQHRACVFLEQFLFVPVSTRCRVTR